MSDTNVEQVSKPKYNTIEEYLEKLLYPTLKLAINDLINEIRNNDYYTELEDEFNQCFFRNKAEILQKQKQLLKLERGSDYSEGDYEYWLRQNMDINDSRSEKEIEKENDDFDPDLDDSDVLNLEEEQLNKEDEEDNKNKFDPIKFLVERLKQLNLNNKGKDELDAYLDKIEGGENQGETGNEKEEIQQDGEKEKGNDNNENNQVETEQ